MSTAGKVVSILVMLMSLAWIMLAAGVDQLNTNGNQKLNGLSEQLAKLDVDVEKAQFDVVNHKNLTSSLQERLDHESAVLRARETDLEKDRSQIKEALARWQYELETVKETIDRANLAMQHRTEEEQASQQQLAKTKSEVKDLMTRSGQLMSQLGALRQEFNTTYRSNVESLNQ